MDIFRKLTLGTKFDFKRFSDDARRLKLLKEPASEVEKTGNGNVEQEGEVAISEALKRKHSHSESEGESEGEEVELLPNVVAGSTAKGRKGKKRKTDFEKRVALAQEEVNHWRNKLRIHVNGPDMPAPIRGFEELRSEFGVHADVVRNIARAGYDSPTPIQMQALPCMLQRRELLACAPTGSGKTAAFIIPLLHQLGAPSKTGVRAVILAPTRELAQQTLREVTKLGEGRGLRAHYLKNANKESGKMGKSLNTRFDILVTTPNRLVWLLEQDPPAIKLDNVEWLVIDESDKLFEEGKTGFRDQLSKIYTACTSERVRRAMFSATYTEEVHNWCRLNLDSLAEVFIGTRNTATASIEQRLTYVGNESGKMLALRELFRKGFTPPVLVFVQSKERARELFSELIYSGYNVDAIHADRTQLQRENAVASFRAGKLWVLICTELMSRGIDFKGVNLVVNFDFPPSAISYIHRIGRTGRAGRSGVAVTFFTDDDVLNLRAIANVMIEAGCPVPDYMLQLKKASRKEKRSLLKKAPERKSVRTVSQYDLEQAARKRALSAKNKELGEEKRMREKTGQSAEGEEVERPSEKKQKGGKGKKVEQNGEGNKKLKKTAGSDGTPKVEVGLKQKEKQSSGKLGPSEGKGKKAGKGAKAFRAVEKDSVVNAAKGASKGPKVSVGKKKAR